MLRDSEDVTWPIRGMAKYGRMGVLANHQVRKVETIGEYFIYLDNQ